MKKSRDILKVGGLILFLSLILLSTVLSLGVQGGGTTADPSSDFMSGESDNAWDEYVNDEFFISIVYPRLLLKKEYKNQGGYDFFVKFEENDLSRGKGVALGVNKAGLEEEKVRVKESITEGGLATVLSEKEVEVGGATGVLLEFEPKTSEFGEKRSVLVFEREGVTYSLSTVPEQMQKIIDSLKFTQ